MAADAASPVLKAAEEAHVGNCLDAARIVAVARSARVDGLYPPPEPAVAAAAKAVAELGLPGIGPAAAGLTRNKLAMREALAAAGLPNPPFRGARTVEEAEEAGRALGLPLIVKPADSFRSIGLRQVDRRAELSLAFARAARSSCAGARGSYAEAVLLEGVMAGEECSVDAIVREGKVQSGAVVGRERSGPPLCLYDGMFAPAALDEAARETLLEFVDAALRALGVVNGCVHAEVMMTQDGPRAIEVAAYPAATALPVDVAAMAGGPDGEANALRAAVGDPLPLHCGGAEAAALYWIPTRSGVVTEIRGLDAARAVEGVREVVMTAKPGDVMGHVVDCPTRDRVGYVVATGATTAAAVGAAKRARDCCEVVTTPAFD